MNGLLAQQQALVQALFAPTNAEAQALASGHLVLDPLWQRGLAAYRANGLALANRALSAAYPVVAALVGDATFEALAHRLWRASPPSRGDVAQWGEALPALLESIPELLADAPYLPDVARLEWALHVAAASADGAADAASFALLAQLGPESLEARLAPGTACITSRWPVLSIWRAHREEEGLFTQARERLALDLGEAAIVWRDGLRPRAREAAPGETAFLQAVKESASLADAFAGAPQFDFGAWLEPAVRDGLLLAIRARPGECIP